MSFEGGRLLGGDEADRVAEQFMEDAHAEVFKVGERCMEPGPAGYSCTRTKHHERHGLGKIHVSISTPWPRKPGQSVSTWFGEGWW